MESAPPIQTAKATPLNADQQLLQLKAANNNPNIATSPFGDVSVAPVQKKTLLGS